jgi:hypothetical protein
MAEPAYFYVNMLSCASGLVEKGLLDRRLLVWLTARTVEAINTTLSNQATALRQGVILAVGRIAFREIIVGDRMVGQTMHRPAYARMMAMAGGLDALQLPALCRRHIQWAERILTAAIQEMDSGTDGGTAGNAASKIVEKDMKVLNKFLPKRPRRYNSTNA